MKSLYQLIVITFLIAFAAACGGGGGGSDDNSLPPPPPVTTIDGNAVDALIVDGTVTAYSFNDGKKGDKIGEAKTDSRGFYKIDIQTSESKPVLLEIVGGSYTEEVSGVNVPLKDTHKLRAVTYFEAGKSIKVMITPFTNLAVTLFEKNLANGENVTNAIAAANSAVSGLLGLDILSTYPANITDPVNQSATLTNSLLYGFYAAAISQVTYDISLENNRAPHTLYTSIEFAHILNEDVKYDGLLDGNDGARLAMGTHVFSAHTYRRDIAAALIKVVNNADINKTGLTVSDILAKAQSYANSTASIFGNTQIQPIDNEAPTISTNHPNGTTFFGEFEYSVNVVDPVGLAKVEFHVNDDIPLAATDLKNPKVTIGSTNLTDGEHQMMIVATDAIGNVGSETFTFKVDNSAPVVQLTSAKITNKLNYKATGTINDQTTGSYVVRVNNTLATVEENGTWFADIVIQDGINSLVINVEDSLGNNTNYEEQVKVDLLPPQYVAIYSDAEFITSNETTIIKSLENHNYDTSKLLVSYTNAALNNTPITEATLANAKIPFVGVQVSDDTASQVHSDNSNLTVTYNYSVDSRSVFEPKTIQPLTGTSKYLIPFSTEFFTNAWLTTNSGQVNQLKINVIDEAGNTKEFNYPFYTTVKIPTINISSSFINSEIELLQFRTGVIGGVVDTCTTDSAGKCAIPILTGASYFLAKIKEGSIRENADGSITSFTSDIDFIIDFKNVDLNVNLTPLSAFQTTFAKNKLRENSTIEDAYAYSVAAMNQMFGFDPISTPVADNLNDNVFTDSTRHKLVLDGWSKMALDGGSDRNAFNSVKLLEAFNLDLLQDGILNGQNNSSPIEYGSVNIYANAYRADLAHYIFDAAEINNINSDLLNSLSVYVNQISENRHESFNGVEPKPFDNVAPTINLTSSLLVNEYSYTATGTFVEDDSGIASITVNGQAATIQGNNWQATINFSNVVNNLQVIATDNAGNSNTENFQLLIDTQPPITQFNWRQGRVETPAPSDFEWQLMQTWQGSGIHTLRYHSDHMATGLPKSEWSYFNFDNMQVNDDYEKVLYFDMNFEDSTVTGVSSPTSEIKVEYQYLINDQAITGWLNAPIVVEGKAIFPLATDLLGERYGSVTPNDINKIAIRLTDPAGNENIVRLEWKANIVVPRPTITTIKNNNSVLNSLNWAGRSIASGRNDDMAITTLKNNSNDPIRVRLDNTSAANFSQNYERGERKNFADVSKGEEWQTKTTAHTVTIFSGESSGTSRSCGSQNSFSRVNSVNLCTIGDCSTKRLYSLPARTTERVELETDDITGLSVTNTWSSKNDVNSFGGVQLIDYSYEVFGGGTERTTTNIYLNRSAGLTGTSCPSSAFVGWQKRYTEIPTQGAGYPRNQYNALSNNANLFFRSITMRTQAGVVIEPTDNWYSIPANETVTITHAYGLPTTTYYNDSEVGNRATFRSYSPKFYDSNVAWNLNVNLNVTSVADFGVNSQNVYTTNQDNHTQQINYSLSRP